MYSSKNLVHPPGNDGFSLTRTNILFVLTLICCEKYVQVFEVFHLIKGSPSCVDCTKVKELKEADKRFGNLRLCASIKTNAFQESL